MHSDQINLSTHIPMHAHPPGCAIGLVVTSKKIQERCEEGKELQKGTYTRRKSL